MRDLIEQILHDFQIMKCKRIPAPWQASKAYTLKLSYHALKLLTLVPMLCVEMYSGRSASYHLTQSVKPGIPTLSIGTSKRAKPVALAKPKSYMVLVIRCWVSAGSTQPTKPPPGAEHWNEQQTQARMPVPLCV